MVALKENLQNTKTATYMYVLIILHPSTLVRQNTCLVWFVV